MAAQTQAPSPDMLKVEKEAGRPQGQKGDRKAVDDGCQIEIDVAGKEVFSALVQRKKDSERHHHEEKKMAQKDVLQGSYRSGKDAPDTSRSVKEKGR